MPELSTDHSSAIAYNGNNMPLLLSKVSSNRHT